jgi:DNA replication and repair protein RecF
MVTGSPGKRRRFLDSILILVDRDYRRSLSVYENGLRRRNRILDSIRDNQTERRALVFWDQLLIKHGNVLTDRRRELIQFLNEAPALAGKALRIEYEASTISEKRLAQYEREEVAAGYSLVGPHRDDFKMVSSGQRTLRQAQGRSANSRDLAAYGSRGEQRMGVLWLKMGELTYIEEKTGERPLLLLDDIFSELDDQHDRMVMELLGKQQTIITTTEVDGRFEGKSELAIERLSD